MNRIFSLCILWLCQLAFFAQAGWAQDASIPVGKVSMTLKTKPANAGNFSYRSGEQFQPGTSIWMTTQPNTDYEFIHWTSADTIISKDKEFSLQIPDHDFELTAVYKFNPESPGNPELIQSYKLFLTTQPSNAGYFNYEEVSSVRQGNDCDIYAWPQIDYHFVEWQLNGEVISTDQNLRLPMPGNDVHLVAVFKFDPQNPGNPNANYWDEKSGEAIVEEFEPGYLYRTIYNTVKGDREKLQVLIVSGEISQYDWGFLRQFPNCTTLDLSRTNGMTYVPTWTFEYNQNLTTLILPAGIESIGEYAFYECSNLTSISCYALTPPVLSQWAFEGVDKSNITVYVPAAVVPLYLDADGWKDLDIQPLRNEVSSLEVNLPEDVDPQVYKDMYIELYNTKSGQTQRYIITDRVTYTFNSLPHNTEYNVYLKNKQGVVLGEIAGVKVESKDVSVTFNNLKELKTITLKVLTPAGEDVTAKTAINWSVCNEKGEYEFLNRGNTVAGLIEGQSVKYQVTLSQELAMEYLLPTEKQYEVEASNAIIEPLLPIPSMEISGKVWDVKANEPIKGATVSVSQTLNKIYTKSYIVKTDADGNWSLTVFKAPTEITASANNYVSKTQSFDDVPETDIPTFELKDINGTTIKLNLNYRATGSETVQDYYEDYANVDYAVYNVTTGQQVSDMNVQYPQIVLMENLPAGTELRITATSKNAKFKAVEGLTTVSEKDVADVTLTILQWGAMKATFTSSENNNTVGILYDQYGRLIKKYDYANTKELTVNELTDGTYTLVTMGNSALFNSVYELSQFASVGLKEKVDFLKNTFTVKSGEVTTFNNAKVPYLDETKLYYTGDHTYLTVNKPSLTAGQYLTISGRVDFKSIYASSVSDVNLIFDLPAEANFVQGSVMENKKLVSYTFDPDAHRLTVPVSSLMEEIRFCVIPTAGGSYAPAASVQFTLNGKTMTQPIGSVSYTAKSLSLSIPSTTASETIPVNGTAMGKSKVEIYDNGTLVGQTTSLANGSWATTVKLDNAYAMSSHEIYAKLTSTDGTVMQSESQRTVYDPNAIQVSKVTMYYSNPEENWWQGKNYELVFDFLNPSTKQQRYTYYIYNRTFTFTVDFTANDPERISNVVLYVKTGRDSKWHALYPTFDQKRKQWVVSSEFGDMYDGIVPVNFSVDYSFVSDVAVDMSAAFLSEANEIELAGQAVGAVAAQNLVAEKTGEKTFTISLKGEKGNTPIVDVEVESLDFTEASALLAQQQFSFAKLDDDSYFCVSDELGNSKYNVTIVDTKNQRALRIEFISDQFQDVIAFASEGDIKTLINVFKKQGNSWLTQYLGVFANLISKKLLTEAVGFSTTMEMLTGYVDNDLAMRAAVTRALNSKCKTGAYRLSDEDRTTYSAQLTDIKNQANLFHQRFISYLKYYQMALLDALCYNIGVTAATVSIGQNIGDVLPEQDAAYFATTLPTSYQLTAERLKSIQLIAACLIQGHTEIIQPGANLPEGVMTFGEWAPKTNAELMRLYGILLTEIKAHYSKCPSADDEDTNNHDTPHPDMDVPIDPSGYVYEAVPSNRVAGVTATIYYKETVEDMYGDLHENVVLWDAEEYAQQNPLFTDEDGMYRWDVPEGLWQVKFEKEGYQTVYSEWLPVPPPQLDVNIALTQLSQPVVKAVKASDEFVDIEFDKYMDPATLNTGTIQVVRNGKAVSGTILLPNEEAISKESSSTFASKVRFCVPEGKELLSVDDVELIISRDVKSYAGIAMQNVFNQNLTVEPRVRSIKADEQIKVKYESNKAITVGVLPADASKGKKLYVRSLSPVIATVDVEEVTLDENGQATITVSGELPGSTVLMYSVEGSEVQGQTTVNVLEAALMETMAPQASRVSGSEVYRGTQIELTCETKGAVIYYTLDGETCPCDLEKAIKYEGPIVINDDKVTIKAFAMAKDLDDSEVVEFIYTLKKTSVGLNLAAGWTWISHNVEEDIPVSELGNNVELIKSQTEQAMAIDGKEGLFGRLKVLKPAELYKVKMKNADDNTLKGYEFNARDNSVPVEKGWNWIGYPLSQTATLAEALMFFTPSENDMIVGHDNYAEYVDGSWQGSLEGLEQGKGYLYKSAVKTEIPFNTSIVSNAASRINKRNWLIGSPWTPDKHAYPNVMPVTAELYDHGVKTDEGEFIVGAFVGTECRGVGQWKNGRLLMTVYGQGGEEITFRAVDTNNEQQYELQESVIFDGEIHGVWKAPMALNLAGEVTGISSTQSQFQVTPAVFSDHITVSAGGRHISYLSLTDMGGRKVLGLTDLGTSATVTTSQVPEGMYIVTVVADGETWYKKMVKANK